MAEGAERMPGEGVPEAALGPAEKARQFPTTPGVYLMKDALRQVHGILL